MEKRMVSVWILICIMIFTMGCQKPASPEATKKVNDETQTTEVKKDTNKQAKIKLTIYCEEDQPREFLTPEGTLTGMSVDLVREIQKRVGNTDAIEMVPWARGYSIVQNDPNVILFSMARDAKRNHLFQWVGPIDEISYAFYGKAGTNIKINSLEDAKKVGSIGVITDEIRDIYLTSKGFVNLQRADDTSQNFKKLMTGRIDLLPISSDLVEVESEANELGYKGSDLKKLYVFMTTQLYIAISKETPPEVAQSWNEALDEMKTDGTFAQIYHEYFPGKTLPGPAITEFE